MAKDITWILDSYEYPPEVTTREWLGSDYSYHKLITNVRDAERFNYHSDYWGDAQAYQDDNVDLMAALEPWVGSRCVAEVYGDRIEGTLEGILIDKQYNSIGHTSVLFSDVTDDVTAKRAANGGLTVKVRDFINLSTDIDVVDDYCEELYIAFCGPLYMTAEGEAEWSDVLDLDVEIYDGYDRIAVVLVDDDEHKLARAKKFFYSAAGYCTASDYDRWFMDDVVAVKKASGSRPSKYDCIGLYRTSDAPDDAIADIMMYWFDCAKSYGDRGGCVIGAGFTFRYQGKWYFMHSQSPWQGSLSWEHFVNDIENELQLVGAEDIRYHWGTLD